MKVVSITSAGNNSGKTSLACALCAAFPGVFTAVKGTTVYEEGAARCPRGEGARAECACTSLEGPWLLCDDRETVERPGTDTGKIAAAGARRTLWAIARPDGAGALVEEIRRRLRDRGDGGPLLTEGNTLASRLSPDLTLFVANPWMRGGDIKPVSADLCAAADLLILNPFPIRAGEDRPADADRNARRFLDWRAHRLHLVLDLSRPLARAEAAPLLDLVADRAGLRVPAIP